MADVAAVAGVSHQTVSRVLNDSPSVTTTTHDKVMAAIEALGYRRNSAARALARNRSGRIGIIWDGSQHGAGRVATAVQDGCHRAGFAVSIIGLETLSEESMQTAVDRLLDERVEVIVDVVAHELTRRRVTPPHVPVVTVQGALPGQGLATGVDQELGGFLATRHLLDLGHRRIAHVAGPRNFIQAVQRREGWRRAHTERGAPPGPEIAGDWSARSGYEAGLRIAADRDVTGVFAASDSMALGTMKALQEQGRRVPAAVSVVGFNDDADASFYMPALTTVTQNSGDLGAEVVDLIQLALRGEELAEPRLVQPVLHVRASTAAPSLAENSRP